jgi:hypothetical protein
LPVFTSTYLDVFMVALVIAFFAGGVAYVRACERL